MVLKFSGSHFTPAWLVVSKRENVSAEGGTNRKRSRRDRKCVHTPQQYSARYMVGPVSIITVFNAWFVPILVSILIYYSCPQTGQALESPWEFGKAKTAGPTQEIPMQQVGGTEEPQIPNKLPADADVAGLEGHFDNHWLRKMFQKTSCPLYLFSESLNEILFPNTTDTISMRTEINQTQK